MIAFDQDPGGPVYKDQGIAYKPFPQPQKLDDYARLQARINNLVLDLAIIKQELDKMAKPKA